MWVANLAVLFLIKSQKKTNSLHWRAMLPLIYFKDVLMVILVLLGVEKFALNPVYCNTPYSQSLYTTLMIFVISMMIFDYHGTSLKKSLLYSILPIIDFCLDLIAYPKMHITWNDNTFVSGAYFYSPENNLKYIAFAVELALAVGLYFYDRYNTPKAFVRIENVKKMLIDEIKKGPDAKTDVKKASQEKKSKQDEKDEKAASDVYSPFAGWVSLKKNKENLGVSVEKIPFQLTWYDFIVVILLAALALPIMLSFYL